MSDDDIDDTDIEDDDEIDVEGDDDLELDDEALVVDDPLEVDVDAVDELVEPVGTVTDEVVESRAKKANKKAAAEDDEEEEEGLDLEEEHHPDDVEVPLDALLQERTAKAALDDDEDDLEDDDADDGTDGPTRIVPRRPGEFLCSSCFLVLPRHQLADEKRMLCRDCA